MAKQVTLFDFALQCYGEVGRKDLCRLLFAKVLNIHINFKICTHITMIPPNTSMLPMPMNRIQFWYPPMCIISVQFVKIKTTRTAPDLTWTILADYRSAPDIV